MLVVGESIADLFVDALIRTLIALRPQPAIADTRTWIVQALIAGAFIPATTRSDSAVVAVREATFSGMTPAGVKLAAGEVRVELIVIDQRGSTR